MGVIKNTEGTRKIAAMGKIESALNIAAILSLQWTSGSTGDIEDPMEPTCGEMGLMDNLPGKSQDLGLFVLSR
jgi:hypothetical protein